MISLEMDANMLTTLIVIFSTGFLGGLSPCTLPTIVLVVGYVSGYRDNSKLKGFILSFFFVLGIAFTLSVLGALAGAIGNIMRNTRLLNYIVAAVLGVMGLWMLKILDFNKGFAIKLPTPKKGSGAFGAFALGIPFGITASPCTLPITASVIAYSAAKGSALYGMVLMFTYAIGRSIPILLVGTFTGLLKNVKWLERYNDKIERVGGIILVLLSLYFVWKA
ncbi:MAG TPA: cytochrome c biogenesis protein CcdA [Clostridia bacterium]|nr:cytochrome c biogenesis protein CcdA [Clostridia bacterium]